MVADHLVLDAFTTPHVLLAGATGSGRARSELRPPRRSRPEWSLVIRPERARYAWLGIGVPAHDSARASRGARRARTRPPRTGRARSNYVAPTGSPIFLRRLSRSGGLCSGRRRGRGSARRDEGKSRIGVRAALQHKAGGLIVELARKGRSAGIHLLVAIQRRTSRSSATRAARCGTTSPRDWRSGASTPTRLHMLGISATETGRACARRDAGARRLRRHGDPRPGACSIRTGSRRGHADVVQGLHFIGPQSAEDSEHAEEAARLRLVR